jgi:hypothetical protein
LPDINDNRNEDGKKQGAQNEPGRFHQRILQKLFLQPEWTGRICDQLLQDIDHASLPRCQSFR